MIGCRLFVAADLVVAAPAAGGTATWSWGVPNDPSLLGGALHLQALVADPPANAAGAVLSGAGTAWIGR